VNDRAFPGVPCADASLESTSIAEQSGEPPTTPEEQYTMQVRDMFELGGQVALITGGSRGLGLQMAEALGEMGCRVVITARKADELETAKHHLTTRGIDVMTVVSDLQQAGSVVPLVDAALDAHGKIDILVNNAGATWGAPAEDYPDEAWHKVMNLNVSAPFFLAREVGKRSMIAARRGKIINVASIAGLKGSLGPMQTIAYNTSKAAAINFTRALAAEWGKYGINVNAICPGFFPSKMSAGLLDKLGQSVIDHTPLQRLGDDDDLKGTVVFLASVASRHVTGQYIAVDGGASVV
jgi:gluconate 5-dehydrogenase